MSREQIIAVLLQHADRLKAMGATGLYMFGSRARGDNRPDSDIDLFMDVDDSRVTSYLDFFGFQLDLEEELRMPVHLADRESLYARIRPNAERDAIRVF